MTLGNIVSEARKKDRAYVKLGLIPVLEGGKKKRKLWKKENTKARLLHRCLELMLASLIEHGEKYAHSSSPLFFFPLFSRLQ